MSIEFIYGKDGGMTVDRHPLWESLGIDLERNDEFLGMLEVVYPEVYLSQPDRPERMNYFDGVTFDIHGAALAVEGLRN